MGCQCFCGVSIWGAWGHCSVELSVTWKYLPALGPLTVVPVKTLPGSCMRALLVELKKHWVFFSVKT